MLAEIVPEPDAGPGRRWTPQMVEDQLCIAYELMQRRGVIITPEGEPVLAVGTPRPVPFVHIVGIAFYVLRNERQETDVLRYFIKRKVFSEGLSIEKQARERYAVDRRTLVAWKDRGLTRVSDTLNQAGVDPFATLTAETAKLVRSMA